MTLIIESILHRVARMADTLLEKIREDEVNVNFVKFLTIMDQNLTLFFIFISIGVVLVLYFLNITWSSIAFFILACVIFYIIAFIQKQSVQNLQVEYYEKQRLITSVLYYDPKNDIYSFFPAFGIVSSMVDITANYFSEFPKFIEFFYDLRDYYVGNMNNMCSMIKYTNLFLGLFLFLKKSSNEISYKSQFYDMAFELRQKSLNELQGLIYSVNINPIDDNKLSDSMKYYIAITEPILKKLAKSANISYYNNPNIYIKPVYHNSPLPANDQDDYNFDFYPTYSSS